MWEAKNKHANKRYKLRLKEEKQNVLRHFYYYVCSRHDKSTSHNDVTNNNKYTDYVFNTNYT